MTEIAVIRVDYCDLLVPEMAKSAEVKIGQTPLRWERPSALLSAS